MTGPRGNGEFCFPETLNVPRDEAENKLYTNYFLDAGWNTNLPRFQGFVRPRELVSFDPWHVTRSPPIGKRI